MKLSKKILTAGLVSTAVVGLSLAVALPITLSTSSKNSSNVDTPIESKHASIPTGTISYNTSISGVKDDATFNTFLSSKTFAASDFTKGFLNVSISYVNNSASYSNSSFKISVSPTSGYTWSDSTTIAKELTVTATIDKNSSSGDNNNGNTGGGSGDNNGGNTGGDSSGGNNGGSTGGGSTGGGSTGGGSTGGGSTGGNGSGGSTGGGSTGGNGSGGSTGGGSTGGNGSNTNNSLAVATLFSNFVYSNSTDNNLKSIVDDSSLNNFLSNFTDFVTYLSGTYSNVSLSFTNSNKTNTNYNSNIFFLTATPTGTAKWSDGTASPREIQVTWINLPRTADASYPSSSSMKDLSLNRNMGIVDDNSLNNYLNKTFSNSSSTSQSLSKFLNNFVDFKNVDVTYVPNSADYDSMTCLVSVTPKGGHTFKDNSIKSVNVKVSLNIDKNYWTCSVPSFDDFTKKISLDDATNTSTLNAFISKTFKDNSKNLSSILNCYSQYKNVTIAYTNGSANYDANSFTVTVTPTSGFSWSDGTRTARTVKVKANIDQNFSNYDTKSKGAYCSDYMSTNPYIVVDKNSDEYVWYKISDWKVTNVGASYRWYWSYSTNGKSWTKVEGSDLWNGIQVKKSSSPLWVKFTIEINGFYGAYYYNTIGTKVIA